MLTGRGIDLMTNGTLAVNELMSCCRSFITLIGMVTYGTGISRITAISTGGIGYFGIVVVFACCRDGSRGNHGVTIVTGYGYASCLAAGCVYGSGSGVSMLTVGNVARDAAVAVVAGGDSNATRGFNRADVAVKLCLEFCINVIRCVIYSVIEAPDEVTAVHTACVLLNRRHSILCRLKIIVIACEGSVNDYTVVVGRAEAGRAANSVDVCDPAGSINNEILIGCDVTCRLAREGTAR